MYTIAHPKLPCWAAVVINSMNLLVHSSLGIAILAAGSAHPSFSKLLSKYVFSFPVMTARNWQPGILSSKDRHFATMDANRTTNASRNLWS